MKVLARHCFFNIALLAVTSLPAFADSPKINADVFGTVDVGIAHLGGSGATRTGLSTGGANISRIGLRATSTEIDYGIKVGFWLEAGMDSDSGTGKSAGGGLFFNRRATLSLLSDDYGELRLGRDDSATFLSLLIFDPFLTNGVGGTMTFAMQGPPGVATAAGGAPIQIGNAVSYFLPKTLGGFSGQFQLASGERKSSDPNKHQNDYFGTRLGYQSGAFNSALSAGRLYADTRKADLDIANIAFSYDMEWMKPMFIGAMEKRDAQKIVAMQLGATAPLGKSGIVKVSAGHYDSSKNNADWNKLSLGYGHNLSRATQIYASLGLVKNKKAAQRSIGVQGLSNPGTDPGGHSHGIEIGFRHFFQFDF